MYHFRNLTGGQVTCLHCGSRNSANLRISQIASVISPVPTCMYACTWKPFLPCLPGNKEKENITQREWEKQSNRLDEGQRTKGRQKRRVPMQLRGFGALNVYASMRHARSRDESRARSLHYSHAAAFPRMRSTHSNESLRKNAICDIQKIRMRERK